MRQKPSQRLVAAATLSFSANPISPLQRPASMAFLNAFASANGVGRLRWPYSPERHRRPFPLLPAADLAHRAQHPPRPCTVACSMMISDLLARLDSPMLPIGEPSGITVAVPMSCNRFAKPDRRDVRKNGEALFHQDSGSRQCLNRIGSK